MKRSYIKRKKSKHDWPKMCGEVQEKTGGFCEKCGKWIGEIKPVNVHHKKKRSAGGTDHIDNLAGLCYSYYGEQGCHQWVESNPLAAKEEGWTL